MHTRTLIIAGTIVALAAPAAASAKIIPAKRTATPAAVTKTTGAKKPATRAVPRLTRQAVTPRQLCICVVLPVDRAQVQRQADFEAQYDQDMIAHGLEPVYSTIAS